MKRSPSTTSGTPSERIDARIAELGGWRGATLARLRALILRALPAAVEEWKWMGTPVWYHDGIVCTGEAYKAAVKTTFAKGAFLDDPKRLFNASLDGNLRRAIDFHEGERIDEAAFIALVRAAAALNAKPKAPKPKAAKPKAATAKIAKPKAAKPKAAEPKAAKGNVAKGNVAKASAAKANVAKGNVAKASAAKANVAKKTR